MGKFKELVKEYNKECMLFLECMHKYNYFIQCEKRESQYIYKRKNLCLDVENLYPYEKQGIFPKVMDEKYHDMIVNSFKHGDDILPIQENSNYYNKYMKALNERYEHEERIDEIGIALKEIKPDLNILDVAYGIDELIGMYMDMSRKRYEAELEEFKPVFSKFGDRISINDKKELIISGSLLPEFAQNGYTKDYNELFRIRYSPIFVRLSEKEIGVIKHFCYERVELLYQVKLEEFRTPKLKYIKI